MDPRVVDGEEGGAGVYEDDVGVGVVGFDVACEFCRSTKTISSCLAYTATRYLRIPKAPPPTTSTLFASLITL